MTLASEYLLSKSFSVTWAGGLHISFIPHLQGEPPNGGVHAAARNLFPFAFAPRSRRAGPTTCWTTPERNVFKSAQRHRHGSRQRVGVADDRMQPRVSERSERNPGIKSPKDVRAREAGDRCCAGRFRNLLRPFRARDLFLPDPGVARPPVAYPWLNSLTATRLVEQSNPTSELTRRREGIHPSAFILHPCISAFAAPVQRFVGCDDGWNMKYANRFLRQTKKVRSRHARSRPHQALTILICYAVRCGFRECTANLIAPAKTEPIIAA